MAFSSSAASTNALKLRGKAIPSSDPTTGDTLVYNGSSYDYRNRTVGARIAIPLLSNADFTLNSTQYNNETVVFTGTPGAPTDTIWPLTAGMSRAVVNSTDQTITVGGVTGSYVAIPSGRKLRVNCDGTNWEAEINQLGTGYSLNVADDVIEADAPIRGKSGKPLRFGRQTLNTTGGTHTLSGDNVSNQTLIVTGALAGDVILDLPIDPADYHQRIWNRTTGVNSVWARGVGSAKKVLIPRNQIVECWVDDDTGEAHATGGRQPFLHARDFGAVGDEVADDTAAIQALFNHATALNAIGISVAIQFNGVYKITSTISFTGTSGTGICVRGEVGSTRAPGGTRLKWAGASGGTLFKISGINASTFEELDFDGQGTADIVFWLRSAQPEGGQGTSGITFYRCGFSSGKPGTGVNFAAGEANNGLQCDNVYFDQCFFGGYGVQGVGTVTHCGFKTLSTGNTKDFSFNHCSFGEFDYGIDWSLGSSIMRLYACQFGNHYIACARRGGAQMSFDHCYCESGNGHGVILESAGLGANFGMLMMTNCDWNMTVPAGDPVMIQPGYVHLVGNTFRNAGACPWIEFGGGLYGTNNAESIYSRNNFFFGNTPANNPNGHRFAPFRINFGEVHPDYINDRQMSISSRFDSGGVDGAMDRLKAWDADIGNHTRLAPFTDEMKTTGMTVLGDAELRTSVHMWELDYTAVKQATTDQMFIIFRDKSSSLQGRKYEIHRIWIDVITAFDGLTTITARAGDNTSTNDQYILETSIKTAGFKGVPAELGTHMTTDYGSGGYLLPQASTNYIVMYIKGNSNLGNGTVTNLTAGKLRVYVKTTFYGL
jgi:hypothetical protein